VLTQIIILYLFWTHINKSGRTSIETIDEVKITISRYGLFKFIRYPIFTIYLLFYFNVFWLFNDHTGIALSLFITIIYIFIGRYRDTQMLDSELSEEYQIYMKKTGLITPSLFYFFK
jgi:protein-S-isoprenylcysteine O-methyltransferase Ste14